MTNRKTTGALLSSVIALVLCCAMLVGSTFAWFTDSASTAVNEIVSGTLNVALEMKDANGNWVNAEGETLKFTDNYWEPGCTYELPELRITNKGNLALKYNVVVNGINGDAKLLEVIDFTLSPEDGKLLPGESVAVELSAHMAEEAGNEYQGKTLSGVGLTVKATQAAAEYDSFGNAYDLVAPEKVIANGTSNAISWTLTDAGTLGISGVSAVTAADIQSLSTYASQITNVKIGSDITEIGEEAFRGLNISAVTFEDNAKLQKIGTNAFRDCAALKAIEIPANVETIGEKAFQGCASLETLTFEANSQLKTVGAGKNAFSGCTSLKSVVLPDSVETIGVACFYGCTNLETVVLGDNVSSIGASAFENSGVTAFEVPAALTVIPNNMLKNTKITTITVGDQVTTVNPGAFENCTELKTAYIGSATIKGSVFAGCSNLETVIFANVTDLDGWAFMNCTNLKTVVINAENNLTLGYNTYTTGAKANWYGNTYYSATGNVITYIASAIDGVYSEQCENCLLGHGWNDGSADGTDILAYTNGGTFANDTTFVDGTLATPTKAGYVFGGWYTESDFSGTAVTTAVAGQIYYAKWIVE